jgi:hypothetical protein
VAHHLRADLDQLLLQARQRPILDRFRRCEGVQEIAEIVGERMKLEPNGNGSERPARQPRPLDRALPSSHEGPWIKRRSSFHPFSFLALESVGQASRQHSATSPRHLRSPLQGAGTIIPHARGTGLGKTGPTLITPCHSHKAGLRFSPR